MMPLAPKASAQLRPHLFDHLECDDGDVAPEPGAFHFGQGQAIFVEANPENSPLTRAKILASLSNSTTNVCRSSTSNKVARGL